MSEFWQESRILLKSMLWGIGWVVYTALWIGNPSKSGLLFLGLKVTTVHLLSFYILYTLSMVKELSALRCENTGIYVHYTKLLSKYLYKHVPAETIQ